MRGSPLPRPLYARGTARLTDIDARQSSGGERDRIPTLRSPNPLDNSQLPKPYFKKKTTTRIASRIGPLQVLAVDSDGFFCHLSNYSRLLRNPELTQTRK